MTSKMGGPEARRHMRRVRHKLVKQNWELYLFLLIPVVYILIFNYWPMFGVQIAFRKYRIADGIWGSQWVGFDQFYKFFRSPQFKTVVPNTIWLSLYGLVAGFPLPIILALALNVLRSRRYKMTVQMITYMPHFISTVVLVGMLIAILNPRIGLYGIVYQAFSGGKAPRDLMGQAAAFRHLYVWSGVWQNMGWSSIIYLAALSAVDTELHEAAQIDGASRFQRNTRGLPGDTAHGNNTAHNEYRQHNEHRIRKGISDAEQPEQIDFRDNFHLCLLYRHDLGHGRFFVCHGNKPV